MLRFYLSFGVLIALAGPVSGKAQVVEPLLLQTGALQLNAANTSSDVHSTFVDRFGPTSVQYHRRIRRLRGIGWPLLTAGFALTIPMSALAGDIIGGDTANSTANKLYAVAIFAAGSIASGAGAIIRARLMVNRRRRWRARDGVAEIDLQLRGPGAALRIAW